MRRSNSFQRLLQTGLRSVPHPLRLHEWPDGSGGSSQDGKQIGKIYSLKLIGLQNHYKSFEIEWGGTILYHTVRSFISQKIGFSHFISLSLSSRYCLYYNTNYNLDVILCYISSNFKYFKTPSFGCYLKQMGNFEIFRSISTKHKILFAL